AEFMIEHVEAQSVPRPEYQQFLAPARVAQDLLPELQILDRLGGQTQAANVAIPGQRFGDLVANKIGLAGPRRALHADRAQQVTLAQIVDVRPKEQGLVQAVPSLLSPTPQHG